MNSPRWGIYYKGVLAETHLIALGARNGARKLIKAKGWDKTLVTIKPVLNLNVVPLGGSK